MSAANVDVLREHATPEPKRWHTLLAFSVIYFVWGSTFLCIRIGVQEVPPFLLAALRFTVAGLALYLWMLATGAASPRLREWLGATILGAIMFLVDYGCLFWAEQRVPSGIAAVILATIPIFITILEILFLRTLRLTLRLAAGLVVGIIGVAVLMSPGHALGEAPLNRAGAVALLVASLGWSAGTILTRKLSLPTSKGMSSALQMLTGGVQLFLLALVSGETSRFHPSQVSWQAWFALAYLIVFGSLIGFTAYVWLLHYQSPTKVGTYAYVNPVVAVILGYFFAGESIGPRTAAGTLLVLISVITVSLASGKSRRAAIPAGAVRNEAES
jgi:drug/metabolite transporter (DMT)-like permease